MKNRLSAKKCRQKKKSYVSDLETQVKELQDELVKYKKIERKDKSLETAINLVN
jgi:hypothetical protein